jgi:selenocysteine lyase/cysteine desulfurase/predicted GNAT family N-acyltransferase
MTFSFHLADTPALLNAVFHLRNKVFVVEQNVPADLERDRDDANAVHFAAVNAETGAVVGTARLVRKGDAGKIGRVAVERDMRGRKIGDGLMRFLLRWAAKNGLRHVTLNAQLPVVAFYERLGFVSSGPIFTEANIEHLHMKKDLMSSFDALRAQFPSAQKCVHLNHAGTSPTSEAAADAVNVVLTELQSEDSFTAYKNHLKRQETLRSGLSRMLAVAPETLAFTRNTSHSITVLAQAIPFKARENVVVPQTEYPANVYPWQAQAWRGVETRFVPADENSLLHEDALIAACDERTRVLAVSWVQWGTGQRLDLAKLGAFCRERNILFAVDIIQGFGALRLNLSDLPVDFASAGCHKWLLAPGGVGLLYVRPGLMQTLLPVNIGWNSVQDPIAWERLHFDELKITADRFEEGTPNILGIAALNASVALLEETGLDAIEERVLALAAYAREGLEKRGLHIIGPTETQSGIVAFRHPTLPNDAVLQALSDQQIRSAVRCGNVRFSPHAYITEADIDKALAALPQ